MTRILVIDDHPIVLQGCCRILEDAGYCRPMTASSPADGLRLYRRERPELIILDLAMRTGSLSGLSFIRRLRLHDRKIPILVFSMHNDPVIVSQALDLGANGYVLKDTLSGDLLLALEELRAGRTFLSHELASEVAFLASQGRDNPLRTMSLRELQTLSLIAEGKKYGAIARELNVSYKTIANTSAQIKTKLGAESLQDLTRIAIEQLPSSTGRRGSAA